MTKGDILVQYKKLTPENRRPFQRWLSGNAVAGAIFILGLIGFSLASFQTQETATPGAQPPAQTISFQEWHGLAHLDNLPVLQIQDLTVVFAGPEP